MPANLHPAKSIPRSTYLAVATILVAAAGLALGWQQIMSQAPSRGATTDANVIAKSPINGDAAYEHLKQLCELGPRPTGSEAMLKQQELLVKYFEGLGAKVTRQAFDFRHPLDGSVVTGVNLIVELHPDRAERVLVAAHYDTRPFPGRDPRNPRGRFVGANDGASGTAVLMELAKHADQFDGKLGVDLVLFDAEEFCFDVPSDKYFVGSEHFANEYLAGRRPVRYRQGVLLDMVGDADLQLYMEPNSLQHAPGTTRSLWETARGLGIREFIWQPYNMTINDDHVPLNTIARIPTCDIIDFQYPAWHTEADAADRCSGTSLAKVGWVVLEWLKSATR